MLNGISTKSKPLVSLVPLTKPAGTAILNLEIPLTGTKAATPRKTRADLAARNQYILKADPAHVGGLAALGIDLVSLGNNHCMDYREAGLKQMQALLDKWSIGYAGAGSNADQALAVKVFTNPQGVRVGLISALAFMSVGGLSKCTPATSTSAGVGTLSFGGSIDDRARKSLKAMISSAKQQCDVLVMGLHWGIEKQTLPSAYQVALGRACIDAGADIVWGNHPHVLQGAEVYKSKPIMYSLGNLISPRPGETGLIKLVYDGTDFQKALFYPCTISAGKVKPLAGPEGQARVKKFAGLCTLLTKGYPNKFSQPMFGGKKLVGR